MTPGQASLLEALFSLVQPPDLGPSPHRVHHTTSLLQGPNVSMVTNRLPPDSKRQDEDKGANMENGVTMIRREPVLDKTVQNNALPFVLRSYSIWIGRIAFEPLKLREIARDFVFSHFADGERSCLIIILLANIGGSSPGVKFVEGESNPTNPILQNAMQCRLGAVKSLHSPERSVLVKSLDSAIHTMLLHFFVSEVHHAITLRREAAPIFRRLCPEPPGAPINLPSLLQNPLRCLGHLAHIDIHFSIVADLPTLFRYEVPIPISRPSNLSRTVLTSQSDGILQWLYGIPDMLIMVFAKMKSLRQDGPIQNEETIALLEQELRELRPYSGLSSERFLNLMRSVVQECWRQAAFIYLYMAVCGDPSGTSRVKQALKRYLKLMHAIKPGRLPDEFLLTSLILIGPSAERKHDREVIRQRITAIYSRDRTLSANINIICVIEDYWARANAEGRQVLWSDVAVSQRRGIGV
ncbi:unnamed protein product [Rhizoctonia solani]|nr:unnamed protein product [Rhizoctonia solani]